MIDTSQMDPLWIAVFTFALMFIFASQLQVKGVRGLLAITGAISIIVVVFMDFQDVRLAIGAIAAMVGLVAGGKFSDVRELARKRREAALEKRRRESMLRGR